MGIERPGSEAEVRNEGSYTPNPKMPPWRSQGQIYLPTHWTVGWKGPKVGLDALREVKSSVAPAGNWISIPWSPAQSFFFALALWPNAGHGLLIAGVSRSQTTTHHSRKNSSGQMISSSQRPLPDNTHHSQQTSIHPSPRGIRTHYPTSRAAADPHLRPRGRWDRQ